MNKEINHSNIESVDLGELNNRLSYLKQEKGIVSRKIGAAKKSSLPIDELLIAMKALSDESKLIDSHVKNTTKKIEIVAEPSNIKLPSQFIKRRYVTNQNKVTVSISSELDKWDEYVNNHNNACVYHSSSIKKVIEKTFGLKCQYLVAKNDTGGIEGVLPLVEMQSKLFGHFYISQPFFNYGGLLATTEVAKNKLLEFASNIALKDNVSHIEYRHCYEESGVKTRSDKVTMLLNLPKSKDILWKNFGTKLRAQINKADNDTTQCKMGKLELVDDFYYVFSRNMRDLGTPVYSKELFINMIKFNSDAHICIVYKNSKAVSAGFVLGWRNTLEIPWASTLREANKYSVNMLLYSELLNFAIDKGYEVFDFGRCSKESSTHRFKKQWGAIEYPLYWHYWLPENAELPQINPNNPKFKIFIAIWKKLPIVIANFIGPFLIKNLP